MKDNNFFSLYKRYGFIGFIRLVFDYVTTKLFFKNARIIRNPNYIRGKDYIKFGKNLTTGVGLRIDALTLDIVTKKTLIEIGDNVEMNDYVHIGAIENIKIGNNVLIGSKVLITDHNHGSYSGDCQDSPFVKPQDRKLRACPVVINDNVWIGENCNILSGAIIGYGCIIGSNSVVCGKIDDYSLAVGIPAKVIKKYNNSTKKWERV